MNEELPDFEESLKNDVGADISESVLWEKALQISEEDGFLETMKAATYLEQFLMPSIYELNLFAISASSVAQAGENLGLWDLKQAPAWMSNRSLTLALHELYVRGREGLEWPIYKVLNALSKYNYWGQWSLSMERFKLYLDQANVNSSCAENFHDIAGFSHEMRTWDKCNCKSFIDFIGVTAEINYRLQLGKFKPEKSIFSQPNRDEFLRMSYINWWSSPTERMDYILLVAVKVQIELLGELTLLRVLVKGQRELLNSYSTSVSSIELWVKYCGQDKTYVTLNPKYFLN